MSRFVVFAKGNVDVRDTLHSSWVAGQLQWNGLNEVLKAFPGSLARVIHETSTRGEALACVDGRVPDVFAGRELPLGAYPLPMQYSAAVYETDADVVALSIQADVNGSLYQHRETGAFLYPQETAHWVGENRRWLDSAFERLAPVDVDTFKTSWTTIIERLQAKSPDRPILIFNVSAIAPGETLHCHLGFDDIYSTRARQLNLALIELSQSHGISIVDVDSIVARHGADRLKADSNHLTAEGYRLVAEHVASILVDLGVL